MDKLELWEIMIPTVRNCGKPFRTRFHRVWDKKVHDIAGGLTITTVSKGQWVNGMGKVFEERMIPVRIACSEENIDKIIKFSMAYYDQEAIMASRISNYVKIVNRGEI